MRIINEGAPAGNIVDARGFFETKRQLAAIGDESGGLLNVEALTDLLAGQADAFLECVGNYDGEVEDQLRQALPQGMQYSLSLREQDDDGHGVSPKGINDDEFEVYQRGTDELWLSMTPHALGVSAMFLEGIIYQDDMPPDDIKKCLLEGAAVQLSWLALGKWAFGILDPISKNAMEVDRDALADLERVAQMPLPEIVGHNPAEREQSEVTFAQHANFLFAGLKYGLAGRLAYDGLMQHSRKWVGEPIDARSLRVLQVMHRIRVDQQLTVSTGATMYDLAVSQALPRRQVPDMLNAMQRL